MKTTPLPFILAGEEIIGQFDGQDRRYHVKDHLGSIRMTINDSQGVEGAPGLLSFFILRSIPEEKMGISVNESAGRR